MAVKLGELMVAEGLIGEQQLDEALQHQKATGKRLGEALLSLGYLSEEDLASCLSKRLGVPLVDLDRRTINRAILKIIPAVTARMHQVLPIALSGPDLKVAMADPTNLFALDDLKFITGHNVKPFVAPQTKLRAAIDHCYRSWPPANGNGRPAAARKGAPRESSGGQPLTADDLEAAAGLSEINLDALAAAEAEVETSKPEVIALAEMARGANVPPMVRLINLVIVDSLRRKASDILLEPYERECRIRFRIDGVLHEVMSLPAALRDPLVSRIKTLFKADITKRRGPQSGTVRFSVRMDTRRRDVDFLVSCVPTMWGESIHMKLVDRSACIPFADLGFEPSGLARVQSALNGQRGMVLLTGPRGSGVSTTFYSALASLASSTLNIMTLEPWVEVDLPGVNQVPMFDEKEFSGAASVSWLARHDANVIGVSEVRGSGMWEALVRAAEDSVVLASIGGGGTASRLVRLRESQDAKTRPQALAEALRVVIAQRLVRRVCEGCRTEDEVHAEFLSDLGYSEDEVAEAKMCRGAGCQACADTGYRGRIGLFETMVVTPGIRDLLAAGADADRIHRLALEEGMMTLRRCGLEKVKAGITTIDEVLRETEV